MKPKDAPVPTEKNLPAEALDMSQYAGMGFEQAGQEAYAIPWLLILQTNSPQCDNDSPEYVKGAKAGDFYNTSTKELYDGKEGILVIPCFYQPKWVEWAPRETGGGFRGVRDYDSVNRNDFKQNERGQLLTDTGNYLSDTRYHFFIVVLPDGQTRQVVMGMASTLVKVSRNLMTNLRTIRDAEGKPVPMFGVMYKFTTKTVSNDKGSWKSLMFEVSHVLAKSDQKLLEEGFSFYQGIVSGDKKVEHETEKKTEDDDAPF